MYMRYQLDIQKSTQNMNTNCSENNTNLARKNVMVVTPALDVNREKLLANIYLMTKEEREEHP